MADVNLSEELQEAFFDRYFEYGDDEDTNRTNAKKAYCVMKTAYETADRITTALEDGECYDEAEVVLAFQTLALSKNFFEKFITSLPDAEQKQWRELVGRVMK